MEGGCLCRAVRYVVEAKPLCIGICHCETCRRIASSSQLPFMSLPSQGFRFICGEPVEYPSSAKIIRTFCGRCGSPLTYRRIDTPAEIDVMVGSLDDPNLVAPAFHIWTSEALGWDELNLSLPAYPCSRIG